VGLKPTIHRVGESGVIPLSPSLDCVGPLARSAEDAAILFQALVVKGTPKSARASSRKSAAQKLKKLNKIRFGLPREFFFDVTSDEVAKAFESAVRCVRKLGAKTEDVSISLLNDTESAGNRIGWAEATHYHQQSDWFPGRASEYSEDVRARLQAGTKVTATEYLEAFDQRKDFIEQLRAAMESAKIDALIVPTTPIAAPLIGEETTRVAGAEHPTRALLLRLNRPANLAGVPAISVPCDSTPAGLPMGVQFIGAANSEELLLEIARVFQLASPSRQHPNLEP